MKHIDLEKGKILYGDTWLSAEELAEKIQEKISSGDMKIAKLAELLEELNTAMESIHVLETKITISKEQYNKLISMGNGNDNECVKKAVLAFIGESAPAPEIDFIPVSEASAAETAQAAKPKAKTVTINCSKCNAPIEIDAENMPSEIRCPKCNARGMLKTHRNKPQFKDGYMG